MYEYNQSDERGSFRWVTVGGRRIKIYDGQQLSDAMKESGKFDKKYKKYYTKRLDSIIIEKYVRTKQENMFVFDANNFYIIHNLEEGIYKINAVLNVEGNENYIKIIKEEMKNVK